MSTPSPALLGRRVEHDERSRLYPARTSDKLRNRSHRLWGGVLDQGNLLAQGIHTTELVGASLDADALGSCTGNAAAGAMNTTPLRRGRKLYDETDAIRFYSWASLNDAYDGGYPDQDTGSSGLAVGMALVRDKVISRVEHAFGLEHTLGALMLNSALLGIPWRNDMFRPNEHGFVTNTGGLAGGHEIVLHAVHIHEEWVCAINSWGPEWGGWKDKYGRPVHQGHFRMTFDTLRSLLANDGDVTVLVP